MNPSAVTLPLNGRGGSGSSSSPNPSHWFGLVAPRISATTSAGLKRVMIS